jgi:hypothetical protein
MFDSGRWAETPGWTGDVPDWLRWRDEPSGGFFANRDSLDRRGAAAVLLGSYATQYTTVRP